MSSRKKENKLREKYDHIIGVDVAGISAIAGPMIFVALEMDKDKRINGTKAARLTLEQKKIKGLYDIFNRVWKQIKILSVAEVSPKEINAYGQRDAIKIGIEKVIQHFLDSNNLNPTKCYFLIDFFDTDLDNVNKESIKNGDDTEYVLSCASIVANILHKQYMKRIHSEFPIYNWAVNFGQKDQIHKDALRIYGASMFHRDPDIT